MRRRSSTKAVARFGAVSSAADIEQLARVSEHGPMLLFLDDPYCPISNFAAAQIVQSGVATARIDVAAFP